MKKTIHFFCVIAFLFGCKDTTDDGPIVNIDNGQDVPEGVMLIFPFEDSLCNEGVDETPTQSTVFFEWAPNNNAETYILYIENLDTGDVSQYETSEFIHAVTINRAQAYRWSVSYDYDGETNLSEAWNFYNSGPGVQTYAPFPAEIISPVMAQNIPNTNTVVLQWEGSDVDDDIVSYDVNFGTDNPPNPNLSDVSNNQVTVTVTSGTIYYWSVVTKDSAGNTSNSGIYQFRILE